MSHGRTLLTRETPTCSVVRRGAGAVRAMGARSWESIVLAVALLAGCGDAGTSGATEPAPTTGPGREISLDPCLAVACGEYGKCVRDGDLAPTCVCDDGYDGEFCARCAVGYRRSGTSCVLSGMAPALPPSGCAGECPDNSGGSDADGGRSATCVHGGETEGDSGPTTSDFTAATEVATSTSPVTSHATASDDVTRTSTDPPTEVTDETSTTTDETSTTTDETSTTTDETSTTTDETSTTTDEDVTSTSLLDSTQSGAGDSSNESGLAAEAGAETSTERNESSDSDAGVSGGGEAGVLWPRCPFTLTHSADTTTILGLNSVACQTNDVHEDNGYLRLFELNAFGITRFDVTHMRVGVEAAEAGPGQGGVQPVSARIYSAQTDPPSAPAMTLVQAQPFDVVDIRSAVITIPIAATVDNQGSSYLVAELFTPSGNGNSFFIGSNAEGETDEGYVQAPSCGVADFTATGNLGDVAPNMHILIHVDGIATGPVCEQN